MPSSERWPPSTLCWCLQKPTPPVQCALNRSSTVNHSIVVTQPNTSEVWCTPPSYQLADNNLWDSKCIDQNPCEMNEITRNSLWCAPGQHDDRRTPQPRSHPTHHSIHHAHRRPTISFHIHPSSLNMHVYSQLTLTLSTVSFYFFYLTQSSVMWLLLTSYLWSFCANFWSPLVDCCRPPTTDDQLCLGTHVHQRWTPLSILWLYNYNNFMAPNSLLCADVPLRKCLFIHSYRWKRSILNFGSGLLKESTKYWCPVKESDRCQRSVVSS